VGLPVIAFVNPPADDLERGVKIHPRNDTKATMLVQKESMEGLFMRGLRLTHDIAKIT